MVNCLTDGSHTIKGNYEARKTIKSRTGEAMCDETEERIVRKAGKASVNTALELLRTAAAKGGKRKRADNEEKDKISPRCLANLADEKEQNAALGFSENHAIAEMRSCLARHDWQSLQQLFPLLLGCCSEIEPIVWRYAFTIMLCSPGSDSLILQEFFEMCMGAQTLEDTHILERLLTLQQTNS